MASNSERLVHICPLSDFFVHGNLRMLKFGMTLHACTSIRPLISLKCDTIDFWTCHYNNSTTMSHTSWLDSQDCFALLKPKACLTLTFILLLQLLGSWKQPFQRTRESQKKQKNVCKNASANSFLSSPVKVCLQDCPTRYSITIANSANIASEKCHQEKRKTVNGEDILFAMTSLGFENYAEALKIYLAKYREVSISPTADGLPYPRHLLL